MTKLRRRILFVTSGLIFGTVTLCASAVYIVASRSLHQSLDNSILQLARTEIASATDLPDVHVHDLINRTIAVRGVPGYEKYVWIQEQSGRTIASTSNVSAQTKIIHAELPLKNAELGITSFGDIEIGDESVRAVFYPFMSPSGEPLIGVVGVPSSVMSDVVSRLGQVVWITGLICCLLGGSAAFFLAQSASRPLTELAEKVKQLDPSGNQLPDLVEAPYEEVSILVETLNGLIKRGSEVISERERTIDIQRQFLADASHELRTPISNLQGTVEVALRRPRTDEEYRQVLNTSLGEVHRMSRLIQDLLTLAKTDLGEFGISLAPVDVAQILREATAQLDGSLLQLRVHSPETLTAVVDKDRLRQALDNLIRNATLHAKSQVVAEITVTGDTLRFTISNDGQALRDEEASQIFERFRRLDYSRVRDTGGSGLGLPIVKAIAESHGGSAHAKTEAGLTSFVISIPWIQ